MAPETRSQYVRRIEESLEANNQRVNGELAQLKAMIKEMATQQIAIQQTLQTLAGEASSSQGVLSPQQAPPQTHADWSGEVS